MSGGATPPAALGNGIPTSRAFPVDRMMGGGGSTMYNPYAPPNLHDMRQANMARARVHTLGPTFSDEEDGDDTEFIQERMRALGLTDRDIYGNVGIWRFSRLGTADIQSIYTHVPYPGFVQAPAPKPKIHASLRPTAPEYTPVVQSGPRADPGYRKYGQADPATSRSYCPYPELASYAQNQRQAEATDILKQMEVQAQAQASARAQLEAMRFQAQMQQYILDETHHSHDVGDAYEAGHAKRMAEEEDEQELLRKLQAVREAKLRKQMQMQMQHGTTQGQGASDLLSIIKGTSTSRSASNSSRTSSVTGSPIESSFSPTVPPVPLPSAAPGEGSTAGHPHTQEAFGPLVALLSRRVTASTPPEPELAATPADANVIDLTVDSPAEDDARAMERRKARAGLAALGHGRPRPSNEAVTPPEPTIPASIPSVRVTSQPVSPNPARNGGGTHSEALQMQRRSVTHPITSAARSTKPQTGLQPAMAAYARPIRQPSGPPNEAELEQKNFAALRRRAAGAGLGMLGRRRMESGSTVSDKSDKDDK